MRKKLTKPEKELAEHLKQAEHHLIGAVKLFSDHPSLSRRVGYYTRLTNTQEAITSLYREELVRARGPQRARRR